MTSVSRIQPTADTNRRADLHRVVERTLWVKTMSGSQLGLTNALRALSDANVT
jgi:hypothetical protein